MKKITYKDARKVLRGVVAQRGKNYKYDIPQGTNSCKYESHGRPSCGVGKALFDFGVPAKVLAAADRLDPNFGVSIKDARLHALLNLNGFEITPKAKNVLSKFQNYQDNAHDYEYCLEKGAGSKMTCNCGYNTNPVGTIWIGDVFVYRKDADGIRACSVNNANTTDTFTPDPNTEEDLSIFKPHYPPNSTSDNCYCDNVAAGIKWSEEYNKFIPAPIGTMWKAKHSRYSNNFWIKTTRGIGCWSEEDAVMYFYDTATGLYNRFDEQWLEQHRERIN